MYSKSMLCDGTSSITKQYTLKKHMIIFKYISSAVNKSYIKLAGIVQIFLKSSPLPSQAIYI